MNWAGERFTATVIVVRPAGGIGAGLLQNPFAQRHDQAGLFGDRDELDGRHHAPFGMMPADEGLAAGDLAAFDVDDRLIVELELVVHDRLAQIQLEGAARLHAGVHLELEEAVDAAAVGLGAVERQIGVLHQGVRLVAVARGHGDADAGPHDDLMAVEIVGSADHLDESRREGGNVGRMIGRQHLHDGKLVAAQPGHDVLAADAAAHAVGRRLQQQVADRMPERIVDALEVVEVEAEDRDRSRTAAGGCRASPIRS